MSSIRDYRILKHIGSGSYGKVYKVEDINGNVFAMKKIYVPSIPKAEKNSIVNEISLLKLHKSKFIIKYYNSFYENGNIYIISEYAERGDFHTYIRKLRAKNRKLSDRWITRFFLQVCIGINYLHKNKVIHRDIKASNIFLDRDYNVKIGDFGIAKPFSNVMLAKTCIGSPYYMSPEVFKEQQYNEKTDVWSLGCFLYELLTYQHPFEANSLPNLMYKVTTQSFPRVYSTTNNTFYNNLLTKMLDKNMYMRCSCEDIINNELLFQMSRLSTNEIEIKNDINKYNYKIPKCPEKTFMWNKIISEINSIIIESTFTSVRSEFIKPSEVAIYSPKKQKEIPILPALNKATDFKGPLENYVVKKEPVEKIKKYENYKYNNEKSNYSFELPTLKEPNLEKYYDHQFKSYYNKKNKMRPISALDSITKNENHKIHENRPKSVIESPKKRYISYIQQHKLPKLKIPEYDKKKRSYVINMTVKNQ